jgi:exonuclease SbcC
MNKIKQINISDFRIYQEKQEFKFHNERGIANLVALYAPNGYGKTSFFDAVEWGYSGEIARIGSRTDDEVQELDHNKELKDKIVLTNRISYNKDPNIKGQVEFVTEKGTFQKKVDLYTRRFKDGNNKGTKNDYKEGIISGDLILPNGHKLVEFNVLSQDQIDRFLRHLTPEQKFNELKDFWAEGEETLNKYEKIGDTIKSID